MLTFLRPGSVVAVPIGPFTHVGIVSDWMTPSGPTIISSSHRRGFVTEEALADFASGRRVISAGYPGDLPPATVIERARSKLGEPWNLLNANCEHLVTWAHGLDRSSPQLRTGFVLLALVGVGSFALRAR